MAGFSLRESLSQDDVRGPFEGDGVTTGRRAAPRTNVLFVEKAELVTSRLGSSFARFCVVGATGMVIDLLTVRVLISLHWRFEVARAVAIWLAMTSNFWLNRIWTFGQRDPMLAQYARFAAACGLGAAMNWGVAVGLVRSIELFFAYPLAAAFVGILAGTISNFLICSRWVFRMHPGSLAKRNASHAGGNPQ